MNLLDLISISYSTHIALIASMYLGVIAIIVGISIREKVAASTYMLITSLAALYIGVISSIDTWGYPIGNFVINPALDLFNLGCGYIGFRVFQANLKAERAAKSA